MTTLSLRTWVRNAAAVFSGCYGAVTRQAEQAGCSRQTVYEHARQVEQRLQTRGSRRSPPAEVPVPAPTPAAVLDEPTRRRLAVTAFAMGISTRQIEDLLRVLLRRRRPRSLDHRPLGRRRGRARPGRSWRRSTRRASPRSGRSRWTRSFLGATDPGRDRAGEHDGRLLPQRRRPQGRDLGGATGPVRPPGVRRLRRRQGDRRGGRASSPQARRDDPAAPALEHGLDVFHTTMEAHRVLARHWRRAEAAWEEAEAADARGRPRRNGKGIDARGVAQTARAAWGKAIASFEQVERLEAAWGRAHAALDLFGPDGRLNDRARAEAEIAAALKDLTGPDWSKVRNFLQRPAEPGLPGPDAPPAGVGRAAARVARGDGLAVVAAAPPADGVGPADGAGPGGGSRPRS